MSIMDADLKGFMYPCGDHPHNDFILLSNTKEYLLSMRNMILENDGSEPITLDASFIAHTEMGRLGVNSGRGLSVYCLSL